jgi:monofunctional biosynthetic peptidoglycan transglycosylase
LPEDPVTPDAQRESPPSSETEGAKRPWTKHTAEGFIAVIALGVLTYSSYLIATWPDVGELKNENPESTAFIEDHRETAVAEGDTLVLDWRWVPYDSISPHLKRAVLVAEDISFFSHRGFALGEIREALRQGLSGERDLRGASTITQQLAKNLWLSPSRNPIRKVKEALLTRQLERSLTKKRILELYLNVAEFGPGIFGAEAAAQHYFEIPAVALDEDQAAQLAAALPRPATWHPGVPDGRYVRYSRMIRERMEIAEFLWRRI